jgi:hypothetical protein
VAPVLQCPECGTKHPLNAIGDRSAFPCGGCGRTLKVPEQARAIAGPQTSAPWPPPPDPGASAAPASAPDPIPAPIPTPIADPHATQVFPTTAPPLERAAAVAPVVTAPPLGPSGGVPPRQPALVRPGLPDPVPGRGVRFLLWIIAVPLAFLVVFGLAKAFGMLSTNDITDVALAEGWHRFVPIARLLPFVAVAIALFVQGGVYAIVQIRQRRVTNGPKESGRAPQSSRQSSRTRA